MNYDDAEAVYSELRWVRDQGFKVWYDEGISPGHTWQDELAEKIDSCSLFLLFVSPKAVLSRNCLRETAYAVTRDKEFLAIYLEETELPSGLALEIGDRQAILKDRFPADIYQGKVIDALSSYLPVPSTDKAADRDEPAAESREPAAIAEGAQLSTRLRAVVAFSAVVVIVLIAFLWRFPVYIPGSDTAESQDKAGILGRIQQLAEQEDYVGAYLLADQLEDRLPNDPALAELWSQFSDQGSVLTEPSGADVWFKDYKSPEVDWTHLGQTPLENVRLPRGYLRLKLERSDLKPLEFAAENPHPLFGNRYNLGALPIALPLAIQPDDMVYVPGGAFSVSLTGFAPGGTGVVQFGPFLIDKHEVTNRQFKEFVDAGGYDSAAFWKDLQFEQDALKYSGPLSHRIALGLPRHSIILSNALVTRSAGNDLSTSIPNPSRL